MGVRRTLFAALYDHLMAGPERAGLAEHRRQIAGAASGRVLEIGGGTGANLPFYREAVSELVIAEPEAPMARRLERKLARLPGRRIPTRVVRACAEQLPFDAGRFDCVVSTLVLCTVADPARAVAEVRRVLAPGGRMLLIEHVRSDDERIARWQDRLRAPWAWIGCGCQCNRATLATLRGAGFSMGDVQRGWLPKAPSIVRPLVVGTLVV